MGGIGDAFVEIGLEGFDVLQLGARFILQSRRASLLGAASPAVTAALIRAAISDGRVMVRRSMSGMGK